MSDSWSARTLHKLKHKREKLSRVWDLKFNLTLVIVCDIHVLLHAHKLTTSQHVHVQGFLNLKKSCSHIRKFTVTEIAEGECCTPSSDRKWLLLAEISSLGTCRMSCSIWLIWQLVEEPLMWLLLPAYIRTCIIICKTCEYIVHRKCLNKNSLSIVNNFICIIVLH